MVRREWRISCRVGRVGVVLGLFVVFLLGVRVTASDDVSGATEVRYRSGLRREWE
jgi:hypothetical protein